MNSFKLSLLPLAILACSGAQATDVSIYGSLDTGLRGTFSEDIDGVKTPSRFAMETGQFFPNMIGLKGSESLGNGLEIGFILESRFNSDDGTMVESGRLFDNQSLITLKGDRWDAAIGRMEGLSSTMGIFDMGCPMDPFEGGWAEAGGDGIFANIGLPVNNALALRFNPIQNLSVTGAYSLAVDTEQTSYGDNSHYGALGIAYQTERLWTGLTYEVVTPGKNEANIKQNDRVIKFAGSYDFGPMKLFATYSRTSGHEWYGYRVDSDSYRFGATIPAGNGLIRTSVQYLDGGSTRIDNQIYSPKRIVAALGYTYNLSKRTMLWSTYSYSVGKDSLDKDSQNNQLMASTDDRASANRQQLSIGMTHFF